MTRSEREDGGSIPSRAANFMIKPFHQWKQEIVEADSKKHNVIIYFRWTREEFYSKYGVYVVKERNKKLIHDINSQQI